MYPLLNTSASRVGFSSPSPAPPINQRLYSFALARYFDWLRLATGQKLTVFFRDGGIGDILCTFPAAATLARQRSSTYTIYCTNPAFVTLPKMLGRFDRVLGIRCSDLVAEKISRRHSTFRFRYPDEIPGNASTQYLPDEFSAPFYLSAGLPWPKLELGSFTEKVRARLDQWDELAPIVCIHTGPTWTVREWPLALWDDLVRQLKLRFGCRVLQIGASRHFRNGERKERSVAGAEDCRDSFDLTETMQLITQSRLLVGIDSGMIHAAVSLARPVVGIFGPTSPQLRLPQSKVASSITAQVPCLGCHHRQPRSHWEAGCEQAIRCMNELSVDSVFAKIEDLW